jgi:hypothetical protein
MGMHAIKYSIDSLLRFHLFRPHFQRIVALSACAFDILAALKLISVTVFAFVTV